jgi:hypothetical protein
MLIVKENGLLVLQLVNQHVLESGQLEYFNLDQEQHALQL